MSQEPYRIIVSSDIRNLEEMVNHAISNGYTPSGGVMINDNGAYMQSVFRLAKNAKAQRARAPKPPNELFSCPDDVDPGVWFDFLASRQTSKHPLTEAGYRRLVLNLRQFRMDGEDLNICLTNSIINGWRGVFRLNSRNTKKVHEKLEYVRDDELEDWAARVGAPRPGIGITYKAYRDQLSAWLRAQ